MAAVVAGCLVAAAPALADDGGSLNFGLKDPSYLWLGAGAWEVDRSNLTAAEGDIAWRPNYNLWIFKPHFGLVGASDGDVLGYGGLLVDFHVVPHVVATASSSVGVWGGGGFDLGSRVEFRSGLDLAWQFNNASRLGVGFYHTSNADLTRRNPGSESALLTYAIPIGR